MSHHGAQTEIPFYFEQVKYEWKWHRSLRRGAHCPESDLSPSGLARTEINNQERKPGHRGLEDNAVEHHVATTHC